MLFALVTLETLRYELQTEYTILETETRGRGIFLPKLLYIKDNELKQNIHRLFRVAGYT